MSKKGDSPEQKLQEAERYEQQVQERERNQNAAYGNQKIDATNRPST
ncbi:hypothetical protein IC620_04890 [Hazenella sp. IB182357]|uniref:Uncharacterized protein n=1 Tax=Polycladospora coralii TaxID=2771432 RepID=A0A926NDR1_9BACL|nr:hypothetical protein [Polycladospora coralii]MBD1371694.1 hypothetical protein [Polycladospora coralii]MBS7529161.1 hypothetical protein [Polycladospora coralii]